MSKRNRRLFASLVVMALLSLVMFSYELMQAKRQYGVYRILREEIEPGLAVISAPDDLKEGWEEVIFFYDDRGPVLYKVVLLSKDWQVKVLYSDKASRTEMEHWWQRFQATLARRELESQKRVVKV